MTNNSYPAIIKSLPKVDINIEGVEAWLAQGDTFQIVFFEIQPGVIIPPHAHKAQYGVLIEGEMTLTIGAKTLKLKAGDSYYIPENVIHHSRFHTFARAMDFFDEINRYEPTR